MNSRFDRPHVLDPGPGGSSATESSRDAIPADLRWELSDLYPDDDAWRADKAALAGELGRLDPYRGALGDSAAQLLGALETASAQRRRLDRLASYAHMRADEDTRRGATQAMRLEIHQLATELAARGSWIEPEILALDPGTIDRFLAEEPGLAPYRYPLSDLMRRREHTGDAREEKILADAGLLADGAETVHGLLVDADLPRPEVELADGTRVALDPAAYARHRASANRDDRRKVFDAYVGGLHAYRRTLGATLDAAVKRDVFWTRARKYGSSLERALDGDAIPTSVYRNLIAQVDAALPTFHRSLELRRRILGVERLGHHDLYAPLVAEVEREYSVDEARDLVHAACAPMGPELQAVARRALDERWIDYLPSPGKRSGAYSNGGAYDVHPYILMNFNGRYDDVSTLAHELGHTLHSWFSNRDQPYPTARYSIFVAEVASTFFEALLLDHALATTDDPRERLALHGRFLESFKGTVVRQTQFAEFELAIHEKVERGEALTGDGLDELYLGMVRRYYGHDAGVCEVGEVMASEWAYIPHFYYDFYVYQYATAFTASAALAEEVLAGDAGARDRVLAFLSAGGSDDPIALLRRAGVDLGTAEPFERTVARVERAMTEIESILASEASEADRRPAAP